MKIEIRLNAKSLDKAVKQLKQTETNYKALVKQYLISSCEWVRDRAIKYVNAADLGQQYKDELTNKANWFIEPTRGYYLLRLHSFHGYMIEFGVGIIGQGTYIATNGLQLPANYDYNIPTEHKLPDNSWIFAGDRENVDIRQENIMSVEEKDDKDYIRTKGNQAVMFLYNAAMDFKSEGAYQSIWQRLKKRYIK